jgi:acetoin:2,6-dichlorophenolindophenol oxidoreductase subunit alpha
MVKALTIEDKKKMYEYMVVSREFETQLIPIYAGGVEIPGSLHLSVGEEAVAVGGSYGLTDRDFVSPSHRAFGLFVSRGMDLNAVMAEWFGKVTGINQGRSGSQHIGDMDKGVMPINAIIGSNIPIATGMALSMKLKKTGGVIVTFFGDGATSIGNFHEAVNMSAGFKLPIVFVCNNNFYSVSTPSSFLPVKHIANRAKGYDMPGVTIDGNDVFKVYETVQEAVERARNGQGPTLVECETYRHYGHSQRDPDTLRDPEVLKEWKDKCPIKRMRKRLLGESIPESEMVAIEEEARKRIEEAIAFARASADPGEDLIMKDVYKKFGGK